jgi:gamma-glutamylcyclotransferase (GGCT)/AIG2-like uncharacterized protein YtfP
MPLNLIRKVFIYGALKPQEVSYNIIQPYIDEVQTKKATTNGVLYDIGMGRFPGLTVIENGTIHGYVFTINPDYFSEATTLLDLLESYPILTDKRLVEVTYENNSVEPVWVYNYSQFYWDHPVQKDYMKVKDGDWTSQSARQRLFLYRVKLQDQKNFTSF